MRMKNIVLAIATLLPTSALACVSSPAEILVENVLLWIVFFTGPLSFISLVTLSRILVSRKYKENRSLQRWKIFSVVVFTLSLLIFVYIFLSQRMLCGTSQF